MIDVKRAKVSYWCPYGHEHTSHEDTDECCKKFDLECEWNDKNDPFFVALGGRGA